jgi:hypothetical protein
MLKNKRGTKTISYFALPPASAAWAAASGPASGHSPGFGPSPGRLLASSRDLAAPPSARLTSLVVGPALVRRQLAGQPQRGRYRLWMHKIHLQMCENSPRFSFSPLYFSDPFPPPFLFLFLFLLFLNPLHLQFLYKLCNLFISFLSKLSHSLSRCSSETGTLAYTFFTIDPTFNPPPPPLLLLNFIPYITETFSHSGVPLARA